MKTLFLIASLLLSTSAFAGMVNSPGLVAYWGMDNTWNDSKGTNHGSALGSATFGAGKYSGGAGSFNGTTAYTRVPAFAGLNFGAGKFTVETWVNGNSLAADQRFFGDLTAAGANLSWNYYTATSGRFRFQVEFTDLTVPNVTHQTVPSNGTWYHLMAINDGSTITLYQDAVASSTTINSSGKTLSDFYAAYLAFGRNGDFDGEYFPGFLDESAIYNTNIKTVSDIKRRMLGMHPIGGK